MLLLGTSGSGFALQLTNGGIGRRGDLGEHIRVEVKGRGISGSAVSNALVMSPPALPGDSYSAIMLSRTKTRPAAPQRLILPVTV